MRVPPLRMTISDSGERSLLQGTSSPVGGPSLSCRRARGRCGTPGSRRRHRVLRVPDEDDLAPLAHREVWAIVTARASSSQTSSPSMRRSGAERRSSSCTIHRWNASSKSTFRLLACWLLVAASWPLRPQLPDLPAPTRRLPRGARRHRSGGHRPTAGRRRSGRSAIARSPNGTGRARVGRSGGALASRSATGEERVDGLQLVGGVLRRGRGQQGHLEQVDDLGVVVLGAPHERREPRATDGTEADVGPVFAGPVVQRLLEGEQVAAGKEVGEDLAQLTVAGGTLGVELGEEGMGVLVRLGCTLDERVLRTPTLDVDAVAAGHGAPLHTPQVSGVLSCCAGGGSRRPGQRLPAGRPWSEPGRGLLTGHARARSVGDEPVDDVGRSRCDCAKIMRACETNQHAPSPNDQHSTSTRPARSNVSDLHEGCR